MATTSGCLPVALVQLLFGLSLLFLTGSSATPLSVFHTVNDLWSSLATGAARETIEAVKKSANIEMELQAVPMETFQVLVGRQHHIGLEMEGVTYDLLLGNEAEAMEEARKRATSASAPTTAAALPPSSAPSSSNSAALAPLATSPTGDIAGTRPQGDVAPLQLFSGPRSSRSLELPATTLTGPLELVLREPEPVGIYAPLAADVGGPVRRVVIEPGATVRVAGLRRVALRRPLDLPRLPGQYLAEVYAQTMTGLAEEGFEAAPGVMYMAGELRKAAMAAANGSSKAGGSGKGSRSPPPPLLSFDVETVAHGSLTISSAPELPPEVAGSGPAAAAPSKLKVRRLAGGTVELSLRQGQVSAAADAPLNPAALSRAWVWPLPHADSASWLPYETLLRSVLAAHPFNIDSVIRRGIGMRLTQSSIQGVHMIAFDMEVLSRQPRPPELEEDSPFQWNETPLEVWEAVVQVQSLPPPASSSASAAPDVGTVTATSTSSTSGSGSSSHHATGSGSAGSSSSGGGGGYRFVPLHVKRKQSYQNTLTLSRSAVLAALTGGDNSTAPGELYGYDQSDLGIAAYAP